MLQDGESAIFILDSKFDPAKDIYQLPPPSGNLQFLEVAMNRIQQDTMAMVGMTTPQMCSTQKSWHLATQVSNCRWP
jgi:hypothetical protein